MLQYVFSNIYRERSVYYMLRMSEIRHIVQPLNRSTSPVTLMQCPSLLIKDNVRICKRMTEEGMDGNVSDFDVQHYCNGNPVNCYYFRNSNKHIKEQSEKGMKNQIKQVFTET